MYQRTVLGVLFLIFISAKALALGIAPQYARVFMQPGETKSVKVVVLQAKEKEAVVSVVPSHCLIDPDGRTIFPTGLPI
jgi:hypothetical protein